MGKENLNLADGKWYPEAILNDLIEVGGLSAKSIGCDITDRAARRFFYDKEPFALLAWQKDNFTIVAFAPEIAPEIVEKIVDAFILVLGYSPFVKYEIFEKNENFILFEWTKKDASRKIAEIMALPHAKNITDITDKYVLREIKDGQK